MDWIAFLVNPTPSFLLHWSGLFSEYLAWVYGDFALPQHLSNGTFDSSDMLLVELVENS